MFWYPDYFHFILYISFVNTYTKKSFVDERGGLPQYLNRKSNKITNSSCISETPLSYDQCMRGIIDGLPGMTNVYGFFDYSTVVFTVFVKIANYEGTVLFSFYLLLRFNVFECLNFFENLFLCSFETVF